MEMFKNTHTKLWHSHILERSEVIKRRNKICSTDMAARGSMFMSE